MQGFTKFDLVVLVVYLGAVLYAGLKFSKKEMKGKEFFRGDGTIPWWVTSVSIFATLLSPISFLSLAGNSYKGTWIMWFAQLGMFVAVPLTIRYFLPVYSRLDIDTAYEYLEIRYKDKGLRILGAIMFIIYQIGRMAIIMYLPSMVLANLTGINVYLLIVAMGVIAIIYSYTGGLKSVLWTDFIQGCVLIAGIVFSLIFLISTINGGFGAIMSELTEGGKFLSSQEPIFNANIFKTSVFLLIVGGGLNTFSSYISSQDIVQRFTTTTDIKQLKKMRRYKELGYTNTKIGNAGDFSTKRFVTKADGQPYAEKIWSIKSGGEVVATPILESYITNGSVNGSMIAISKNSKNPEKAMEFLNLLNTDRYLRNLINYGIEGVHYEKVSNNKVRLLEESKNYMVDYYTLGNLFITYVLEDEPENKWDEFKEVNNNSHVSQALGFKFDTSNVTVELEAVNAVLEEFTRSLYTGLVDTDEYVSKLINKLESAGIDKVKEELEIQLNDWKIKKQTF